MKILKLCLSFFLFTFCYTNSLWATHNRAGEIVIDQIGPLTIRATIITYTKASSTGADRAELPLVWGDGKLDTVRRSNGGGQGEIILGDDLKLNIYTATHTYLGRGRYTVSMTDPNRNAGILNVNFPNSVDIPFYLQTTFTFLSATSQGFNSTPRLLQPPIDKGCTNKRFIHSFNAFDPDGDSVAYRLITPLQAPNRVVPGYTFPDKIRASANNRIRLDERSGEFIWETPQEAGEYNVAFHIISYRNGSAIDTTIRDMQILIENCDNNPPKITTIDKICVIAGQEVKFAVTGTDPDAGQLVALSALGGPFVVSQSPAVFRSTRFDFKRPPVTDTFRWRTVCEHIENYPYTVTFKAEDNFRRAANDSIKLVDLKTVQIKVVGPPPQNVQANSISGAAIVSWAKPYACENAANRYFYAFQVWRREGNNPFQLDTCSPGLAGRGYTRVPSIRYFRLM
ncbi:MAG: hypothetical protein HC817_00150 [Saprospiraceae bacterium]|nr:hypothetical protein [Saprospiraceae bacterium]